MRGESLKYKEGKQKNIAIEKIIKILSKIIRDIPGNRKKTGIFIKASLIFAKYKFDYSFRLRKLGIIWSSKVFLIC